MRLLPARTFCLCDRGLSDSLHVRRHLAQTRSCWPPSCRLPRSSAARRTSPLLTLRWPRWRCQSARPTRWARWGT